MVARGLMQAPEKPPEEDAPTSGSGPAAMPSRTGYVPPSLRARMAGGDPAGDAMRAQRRDENSVRVTNLSPDTREDDLRVRACSDRVVLMHGDICLYCF